MGSRGRPYRTLRAQGFEILVGREAEDNDFLTFQVAEPHDVWMHVAGGVPGSHVVVRNPEKVEIPQPVIQVAAAAAAWYSKARGSPRAEVHYCPVANVSKDERAPAGQVEITRWKSVHVQPGLPAA